jgi:type 1 fimbria pilin
MIQTQKLAGLVIVLTLASAGMSAQMRSRAGNLQVSATVVSSSQLVEQLDGSFRLVVANAPDQAEVQDLQLVANRRVREVSLQDANAVSPALPKASQNNRR